jgi:tetratricopeptide (TPR) repeat protein
MTGRREVTCAPTWPSLQGNYYADIGREAEVRAAIVELGKATRIDPSYAMAWAELSRVWTSLAATALSGDEARDAYSEARRSGDRALALDPELAYAHIARGWLLENADLDWAGATREYKAAMRLAPELMQNRFSVGSMLALQGQLQDAVRLSREALATDPLAGNWWIWLAAYLSALGRLDEAEAAIPQGHPTEAGRQQRMDPVGDHRAPAWRCKGRAGGCEE